MKKKRNVLIISGAVLVILIILVIIYVAIPYKKYNHACNLMSEKEYEAAYNEFWSLDGFLDSEKQIEIIDAIISIQNKEYDKAIKTVLNSDTFVWIHYNISTSNEKNIKTEIYNKKADYDGLLDIESSGFCLKTWQCTEYEYNHEDNVFHISFDPTWYEATYTVTYDCGNVQATHSNPLTYNRTFEPIVLEPAKAEGYLFKGWYSDKEYSNEVKEIQIEEYKDITLYAKWEIITYTIEYDLANGSCDETLVYEFTINDLPIILPKPQKEHYIFDCWADKSMFGDSVIEINECKNYKLYACFDLEGLIISISDDESYCIVVDYNGTYPIVEVPEYCRVTGDKILPIKVIGENAFRKTKVKEVYFPDSVIRMESSVLCECDELIYVKLSDNLEEIYDYVLKKCPLLKEIEIPISIKFIAGSAFTYSGIEKVIYAGSRSDWYENKIYERHDASGTFYGTIYFKDEME